jgi:hypothetical protein
LTGVHVAIATVLCVCLPDILENLHIVLLFLLWL